MTVPPQSRAPAHGNPAEVGAQVIVRHEAASRP